MYLKSVSLRGFKSFPDRTRLSFAPGVSVIVGPNGTGKSNITDAILWALGEQSPLAVRGQSMQDVIFAGGKGQSPRRFAEVEVVIDNSEGRAASEFSEISISRRIDRGGEGVYRLNGARCRLADVLEVLSDTNMGREMHSVISQGRVEAIVSSKPRDRRMLIEEAAGLGKHRKRRHRAQLRLERTRDNLDRALDVEREARSRMRPLKAQAESAERHSRLRREEDELRAEFVAGELREHEDLLRTAERTVKRNRTAREKIEAKLSEVAERRGRIEEQIAAAERQRRTRSTRLLEARSALERVRARADAIAVAERELRAGLGERQLRLQELSGESEEDRRARDRVAELEAEVESLPSGRDGEASEQVAAATAQRDQAQSEFDRAAKRHAAIAGQLAAVEARLAAAADEGGELALAGMLRAAPGLELALSAALGWRTRALVAESREEALRLLADSEAAAWALLEGGPAATEPGEPPSEDARPLLGLVEADERARGVAERLLADAWLVEDLDEVPEDFGGIAVTIEGACLDGSMGELRRLPREAGDPALVARSQREELALRLQKTAQTEERGRRELELAEEALADARSRQRRASELAEQPDAVRKAQLQAELAAERRHAEAAERALRARQHDREALAGRVDSESRTLPLLERTREALLELARPLEGRVEALESESEAPESDDIASELRECSQREFGLQAELREASEALTAAEVDAAQLRDRRDDSAQELERLSESLERKLSAAEEPLDDEARAGIEARLERLVRRRDQLGPVNPLAEQEYSDAREHLSELREQRQDLERGLRELQSLIRRTDREIASAFEETFEATANNFEEMIGELFPGGRGRLRRIELGPRPVPAEGDGAGPEDEDEEEGRGKDPAESGVEIEVNPAGKAMRRLSLLSGGEKSLVALAFVFAVLLARPCPFYILDEVEAALDDLNLDRFLRLVRRFSNRSQFVVVTHQKRTMDAADVLYGVSMGEDGITKVVSRRLPREAGEELEVEEAPQAEAEAA
jgi:chromosome segregation protein